MKHCCDALLFRCMNGTKLNCESVFVNYIYRVTVSLSNLENILCKKKRRFPSCIDSATRERMKPQASLSDLYSWMFHNDVILPYPHDVNTVCVFAIQICFMSDSILNDTL